MFLNILHLENNLYVNEELIEIFKIKNVVEFNSAINVNQNTTGENLLYSNFNYYATRCQISYEVL